MTRQVVLDRYDQAIQTYLGLSDFNLYLQLHYYLNGLLTVRMMRGATIPLVEQARPFIEMLAQVVQKAAGDTQEKN